MSGSFLTNLDILIGFALVMLAGADRARRFSGRFVFPERRSAYSSRKALRSTLPTLDFGSTERSTICLGTL
jgi:hypothetical protein